jgi:CubicO group peptidase (beta-lactamase class C family)
MPRASARRSTLPRFLLPALLLALFSSGPTFAQQPADTLVGLWKAVRRFGPDARGPLLLTRDRDGWHADMMGLVLPVAADGGELSFSLPDGQGTFRSRLPSAGSIAGHWFPPPSSALLAGARFASPVRLVPDGPGRWRGEVVPFDDEFSFYLLARPRPDGSLDVVLRNPDRDFGGQIGARRLVRSGTRVTLLGARGIAAERELAAGSYDPEADVLTLTFPARGGSYDFHREGDESGFYPRGRHPAPYAYRPPPALADGWPTASLEAAGIDRLAVERIVGTLLAMPMDSLAAPQVHALLVARHGRLVLEEYFHGEHRARMHETRSAAKSVTSMLTGAAMRAGVPVRLASPVYAAMGDTSAGLDPRKRAMTLRHLLTMASGYDCDDSDDSRPGNEGRMLDQSEEPDYYRFTLAVPLAFAPGDRAVYCSINPNLALGVVARAAGRSPMDLFDRLLGEPMGIRRYAWVLDPAGHPYGGGSVRFLPRDFLKFGQLMLDGGVWRGRRLLDRAYVDESTSPLVRIGERGYGFLWWGLDYPVAGRPVHAFAALGTGGQVLVVVPSLDLVIGSFGGNFSSAGWRYVQNDLIPNALLPAVRRGGP